MDTLEFLKSLSNITDKINKSITPLKFIEYLPKINTGIPIIDFLKDTSYHNSLYNEFLKLSQPTRLYYDFNKIAISQFNNRIGLGIDNEVLNKINTIGYWGNIAKISLVNGTQIFVEEDLSVSDFIEDNTEDINYTIEQIEKNSLDFSNNIVICVKEYMDKNPSVKYSATFIAYIISIYITIFITNQLSNTNSEKPSVNQIFIDNNSDANSTFKVNRKFVSLKNYPRNDSRSVYNVLKNDKVKVLKDSLKWAFVIKENSVETGWIRKEFLDLKK